MSQLIKASVILVLGVVGPGLDAQDVRLSREKIAFNEPDYSPFVDQDFPTRVFWGDTHLHTANSLDAGLFGTTLRPEDAYRFARGEEVTSNSGLRVKLVRPLDFLVVADHAEYAGVAVMIEDGDPTLLADPTGKRWYDMFNGTQEEAYNAFLEAVTSVTGNTNLIETDAVLRSYWEHNNAAAEAFNEPGRFTALIGFEWGSMPDGRNLHRVVVFRDGADRTDRTLPLTSFVSEDPERLWAYMAAYEEATNGRVLAIPHNGNISNGLMFAVERMNGQPLDVAYAEARSRWEPLYEVTQMKGDAEAHPVLFPNDEFADFETWDVANLDGSVAKEDEMLQYEYARSALMNGLSQEATLGANPFKFGMIGSTDAHTALPTTREDNNFSKSMHHEPSAGRFEEMFLRSQTDESLSILGGKLSASGLAAVWARENTREALFDAMTRKEVYATTGSRISVRVFGGWEFEADEVERPDFAERGYEGGVPMGGDLNNAPSGEAPKFMIRALRDPDNANLDRVQVIKGWLDASGETHERIYDVACSDGRAIRDRRCERPVGNTVDIEDASYTNTIGDPLLTAHWEDPDFDVAQSAFYYVRVLEIPKPRWTAYDAKFYDIEMPEGTVMEVQDRAYTSPIWYTPGADDE